MERKFDLDERLIDFASNMIDVSESLPSTIGGKHIAGQLVRSWTAPALYYGEAQGPNQDEILYTGSGWG